jgi:hypothetical protein
MISFAGVVKGKDRHPYIYAIAKRHCLYIGETQRHPVARWGHHLSEVGSFLKRLQEADEEVWASDDEIIFLCIDCKKIASISSEEHKIVTQYVEHKVHEYCILNLPLLAPIEKIVSDTTRTAPARCRYSWGDLLAELVYKKILLHLREHYP